MKTQINQLINKLTEQEIYSICSLTSIEIQYLLENNILDQAILEKLLEELSAKLKPKTENHRSIYIQLLTNSNSNSPLNTMFSVLDTLNKSFTKSKTNIITYQDAKKNLFQNTNQLLKALNEINNPYELSYQINQVIHYWLENKKILYTLQVKSKIEIKDEFIYFKTKDFGEFKIGNISQFDPYLLKIIKNNPNKMRIFELVKLKSGFFIKINLETNGTDNFTKNIVNLNILKDRENEHERKIEIKSIQQKIKSADSKAKKIEQRKLGISILKEKERLNAQRNAQRKKNRLASQLARSYIRNSSKTVFQRLEGWHMQGGLPSLGKRK